MGIVHFDSWDLGEKGMCGMREGKGSDSVRLGTSWDLGEKGMCRMREGKGSDSVRLGTRGLEFGNMENVVLLEITLRTDCQAIISFYNKTNSNKSSRVRWIKFANAVTGTGVKINIEHIEGKHNTLADSLSRLVNLCFAECTGEIKELAATALHSVEEVLQSPNAFQKNMKITCEEVMKISSHFQESSQKLSSHMKNQEHYTDAICLKPTKPQSEWINLMRGDQFLKTLNYQQQKKQLKPCETYKQSYNEKLKSALDNQPRTTTGQIKEKMFEFKTRKPEESSSNWKPWHRD
nr:retrotransposon protein, putative, Ty3-gypsy subclass [Tanacetum cinerariifolium]